MGYALFVVGSCVLSLGYFHLYGRTAKYVVQDFYANFGAELISIAITVLIVDSLAKRREERELRAQLIQDMEGQSNQFSLRALAMLRAKGWLSSKLVSTLELSRSNLSGADLSNLEMKGKYLAGIILRGDNLEKTDFRD